MASIPDPPVGGGETSGADPGGDYDVGAPLREGWAGTIREGTYLRTGRRVTVQVLRRDLAATTGFLDRLGVLGRQTAGVRDPHLLAVYDLVDRDGTLELIAEWSDGATLAAVLQRGPVAPAAAVGLLVDVLAGLEALHDRGLFHGQVGPETVVVEPGGRARLAELAICAAAAPSGFGPHTDVRDTARLGLHLLRKAGSRLGPVRRPLDAAAVSADATDAARLRADLDSAATAALGADWRDRPVVPARGPRRRGRIVAAVVAALVVVAAAVAAAILLTGHAGPGTASAGPLMIGSDTKMAVTPASGGCNTTFAFVARGSLSGAGTLVYRWEQSDGEVTPDTSLPINSSEGSFGLSQAWRLEGSQKVSGSMTLHILKPVDRKISQTFTYNCP